MAALAECAIIVLLVLLVVRAVRLRWLCLRQLARPESEGQLFHQLSRLCCLVHLALYVIVPCFPLAWILTHDDHAGFHLVAITLTACSVVYGIATLEMVNFDIEVAQSRHFQRARHRDWQAVFILPEKVPRSVRREAALLYRRSKLLGVRWRDLSHRAQSWMLRAAPRAMYVLQNNYVNSGLYMYQPYLSRTQRLVLRLLAQDRKRRTIVEHGCRYVDSVTLVMLQESLADPRLLPIIADRLEENGCYHRLLLAFLRRQRLHSARLLLLGCERHGCAAR